MPSYAARLSSCRNLWFWVGRQGSTGTATLTVQCLDSLWRLEAPNPPGRKQEKDFAWIESGNRQPWSLGSALWSRICSQPWLHIAAPHLAHRCSVLLLTFVHVPAEVAVCWDMQPPSASAGKGKPRDPHLLGRKQKVGELAGTEGYTDSVHPLWRPYQGNSFPYDLFWETWSPRKAARYSLRQVSYPKQQQSAAGLRGSSYIGGYKMSHFCLISRGRSWMVRQNRALFNHPRNVGRYSQKVSCRDTYCIENIELSGTNVFSRELDQTFQWHLMNSRWRISQASQMKEIVGKQDYGVTFPPWLFITRQAVCKPAFLFTVWNLSERTFYTNIWKDSCAVVNGCTSLLASVLFSISALKKSSLGLLRSAREQGWINSKLCWTEKLRE